MSEFIDGEILYENPLAQPADIAAWVMEGSGTVSFPKGKMRQESLRPRQDGQAGNIVHWCPITFPDNISISWDFQPLTEPGLAILFFSALGRGGEDILTGGLAERNGPYNQYHHGDLNALHVSYFRRNPGENEFQTCNLRKSHGFHLVTQGADPLPTAGFVQKPYRIKLIKYGPRVSFSMAYDDECIDIFSWDDDGQQYGPVLAEGKIGFRQMTPLIAEYSNLVVRKVAAA
ncbi:MAG: DUF1961 family protein [Candidatus Latescibacteria bacterium]|nr:DUF1961 family protein [Candidatus Latescibacterota bacterium]